MLAPSTFRPPPAVEHEAERILRSGNADEELVIRLATDERMKFVWRVLSKHKSVRPQLSKTWAIMKVKVEPPQDEDVNALALFFWCAYTIASLKLRARTYPPADLPIKEYKLSAAELRYSSARLLRLNLQYLNYIDFDDRHIKEIEIAANFCDIVADEFTKLKTAQTPLVVKRNYGELQARGYIRMLAVEARKIFGKAALGNRTLAKVASVALKKNITDVQVRKWCASLSDA